MLRVISRVFFLVLIWGYTVFKIILLFPDHWILAQVFCFLLYVVMFAWMFIYRAKPALLYNFWYQAYTWFGSTLMGWFGTFILLSMLVDSGFLITAIFHSLFYGSSAHLARLYHQSVFIILILSTVLAILGFIEMLRGPRVREILIPISNLPPALINFKIAQISDLHVGMTIRKAYVEKVVARTNTLDADIIVITGDIADAKADSIKETMQPLAGLKSRLGIFYVTGNHEYYWNAEDYIQLAGNLGFVPLINENRVVTHHGIKLLIAGVTDPIGGKFVKGHEPDLKKAAQTTEEVAVKILLAHRPDISAKADKMGFDLQCSGHTHGGQFFPFNLVVALAHEYYRKLNKQGRMWLQVNPGTGYWGPANRFGIPSEISLLKLTD
jgi:predicted MPP superfamily phosphohydrolase